MQKNEKKKMKAKVEGDSGKVKAAVIDNGDKNTEADDDVDVAFDRSREASRRNESPREENQMEEEKEKKTIPMDSEKVENTETDDEVEQKSGMTADEQSKAATLRNQARRDAGGGAVGFKWCNKCFADLPLDAFGKQTSKLFGRAGHCKACASNGSKNDGEVRKETEAVVPMVKVDPLLPKRRGRPPGSKNKPKMAVAVDEKRDMDVDAEKVDNHGKDGENGKSVDSFVVE
jgi:hypothetical protein